MTPAVRRGIKAGLDLRKSNLDPTFTGVTNDSPQLFPEGRPRDIASRLDCPA